MKRMVLIVGILVAAGLAVASGVSARAEEAGSVRIVLIQASGSDAKLERIDIQNTSNQTVDITDWKLVYKSATGSTTTPLIQFASEPYVYLMLDADDRESIVSKELAAAASSESTVRAAEQFAAGINHLGGGVQLLDSHGVVVDMVGWGTAGEVVRRGGAAAAMTSTTWLVRSDTTGDNAVDFILEAQNSMRYPVSVGALYEVEDICVNLPDIQLTIPDGYASADGNCHLLDMCRNLEGVQSVLPDGMEPTSEGDCQPVDLCLNMEDIQEVVPVGYEMVSERLCETVISARLLRITELLPNPAGADESNEFIELYNADTEPVALRDYQLVVGEKAYALPTELVMQPSAYVTVSDRDLGVNLANTTGLPIWLTTVRGVEVASAPAYANAKDDVSWALIDDVWQYTYAPTPGESNVALSELPCEAGYARDDTTHRCRKLEPIIIPSACRDGQYRSEETGRCRSFPAASVLVPCKEGQYRSEETNRCRSFAALLTSAVKSCNDDQFRNPLTNRCKKIASSDEVALADCGEGRERNPVTNRCRNSASGATVPATAFAVEPIQDAAEVFVGWWAIGGVGALALGYAGWEWRREVLAGIARIREAFIFK